MTDYRCKIWPEYTAKRVSYSDMILGSFAVGESPRAGGSYTIDELAAEWCEYNNNDSKAKRTKARLTTWLINRRLEQDLPPYVAYVDIHRINEMVLTQNLSTQRRADRLLRKLTSYPSSIIDFTQTDDIVPELLAWSESVDVGELNHLLSMLQRDGFVHYNGQSVSVNDAGHQHIQDLDDEPRARIGF